MLHLAGLGVAGSASPHGTWVYEFALLEAAVKLRRRAWQTWGAARARAWSIFESGGLAPEEEAELGELLRYATRSRVLSPQQGNVVVALALNGVPIDVLAERLGTTRQR